jgi:hypothetical protein
VSVRTLVLVAASSAFIGGIAGASVAFFATAGSSSKAPKTARGHATNPSDGATEAALEERLASVEQALRVLERRGSSPLRALPALDAGLAGGGSSRVATNEAPPLVDDPVFEAAVRDLIDRAEVDRENEREVRREDRRKQMASRWTDDIAPRLGLNEQQKAKLLDIAQQFMSDLSRVGERDGGVPAPRAERRAEMQKLRAESEQKLRAILDPGQMRAYEALDDQDKLGFPRRGGGRGDSNR